MKKIGQEGKMACKCKCKKEDGFIEFLIKEKEMPVEILGEKIQLENIAKIELAIKEIRFIDNCMYLYQTWNDEN